MRRRSAGIDSATGEVNILVGCDAMYSGRSRAEKLRAVLEALAGDLEYYHRSGDSESFMVAAVDAMFELDCGRPIAKMLERTIVECDEQLARTAGGAR